jgi:hydrogenase nickel incorporation protein HypA/HybF
MHELAITQSIVDAVAERTQGARVAVVHLRVGKLSGVVPDAVRFCFELVADGTPLEGARLDIEEPAGQARCRTCARDFTLADLILLCPCGSADVEMVSGQELRVQSVEVAARV